MSAKSRTRRRQERARHAGVGITPSTTAVVAEDQYPPHRRRLLYPKREHGHERLANLRWDVLGWLSLGSFIIVVLFLAFRDAFGT